MRPVIACDGVTAGCLALAPRDTARTHCGGDRALRRDQSDAPRPGAIAAALEADQRCAPPAAIAAAVQGHSFTAAELLAHTAVDPDLSPGAAGHHEREATWKTAAKTGPDDTICSYRLEQISRAETGSIRPLQVIDLHPPSGNDGDAGANGGYYSKRFQRSRSSNASTSNRLISCGGWWRSKRTRTVPATRRSISKCAGSVVLTSA